MESHTGYASSWRFAPRGAVAALIVHLLFEYLRLHQVFPVLDKLKIQTVLFGLLLLIVILETGRRGVRLDRQSWLLLGFLGVATFTILTATNQFYAYRFAYGLMLNLIGYFAITHILQNERDLRRFLSWLVGIHVYLAAKVVLGFNAEFTRAGYLADFSGGSYFLGDENDVALAMILILPLAIYFFRQTRSLPGRTLWGIGSVMIFLSVIFSFSRGGFIGLAGLLLFWVASSKKKGKAVGAVLVALMLVVAVAPASYWERIETIQDTESGTAQQRRDLWAAARRMFRDSPIWGVGGNNFGVLLPEYALEFPETRRPNIWGKAVHSMYFQLLSEFGLLGVLLIGSVLFLNFRDLRQVIRLSREGSCSALMGQLAESLRVSWVGFLVPAAFLSVLNYPHLYYLTALTVVARDLASADEGAIAIEPVTTVEKVA